MPTTVLLVEDCPGDVGLCEAFLERAATTHEITVATRLSDALDRLASHAFDVVLLDLNLPDSTGIDTLKCVRNADADVPIVLLTGNTDAELAVSCIRSGAQDYLLKNAVSTELLARTIAYARERKHLELALRRSEERYRDLFEYAPFGVLQMDRDGGILNANPALIHMLKYEDESQLLKLNAASDLFVHPRELRQVTRQLMEDEAVVESQVSWTRFDEKVITVRLACQVAGTRDVEPLCFEMTAEDITERLALEAQLRQALKMEAVGQLAGGVAHEINNLLAIIAADSELIKHSLTTSNDELASDIEKIRQVALRGGRIVKRLLGYSRRQHLATEVIDLCDLVKETVDLLKRLVPEYVKVECDHSGSSGLVKVDPDTVEQILMNLTTNARDAMPDGGVIRIGVRSQLFDEEYCQIHPGANPGLMYSFWVSDNGVGMDAETLESVFEPFYSTKEKGKGTGLGMATVYGLVKQQGGFIWVDSAQGQGTTVEVFFPEAEEVRTRKPRVSAVGQRSMGSGTNLLVEDEYELRRAAKRALEMFGFNVVSAADGMQGLEEYRKNANEIDVVLTDVVMPELGGPAMVQSIAAEVADRSPGIVFMSGYSGNDLKSDELSSGEYALLEKPWEVKTLLKAVQQALSVADTKDEANRTEGEIRGVA